MITGRILFLKEYGAGITSEIWLQNQPLYTVPKIIFRESPHKNQARLGWCICNGMVSDFCVCVYKKPNIYERCIRNPRDRRSFYAEIQIIFGTVYHSRPPPPLSEGLSTVLRPTGEY